MVKKYDTCNRCSKRNLCKENVDLISKNKTFFKLNEKFQHFLISLPLESFENISRESKFTCYLFLKRYF